MNRLVFFSLKYYYYFICDLKSINYCSNLYSVLFDKSSIAAKKKVVKTKPFKLSKKQRLFSKKKTC
jgi:hypothetical protein